MIRFAPPLLLLLACPALPQAHGQPNPLVQGLELYRRGNCTAALPLFEGMLQRQPRNAAVRKLAANCLDRLNRPADARVQYETVLKIAPGDADAVRALHPAPAPKPQPKPAPAKAPSAEAVERLQAGPDLAAAERLIKSGQLAEAERVLTALCRRLPHLTLPEQRLAEVHTLNKRFDRAADLYRSLAARPNAAPLWLYRAAQNYSWQENYSEAVAHYRMYLQRHSADPDAILGLSNALLWSDNLQEAAASYHEYLNLKPNDNDARMNMANALLWSKRYNEAIDEFRALQRRRPEHENTAIALAQCYEQLGRFDEALVAYESVLKLNPNSTPAVHARERLLTERPRLEATARIEKGDFGKAATLLVQYLERHPDSTDTILQLARTYNWSERYREAAGYYERYLAQKPDDEAARRELARVNLTLPDFAAARKHFRILAAVTNPAVEDLEGLVNAHVWENDLEAAQPFARKLADLDPGNGVAHGAIRQYQEAQRSEIHTRARQMIAAGRYKQAIEAYTAYSARFGADSTVELTIARLYSWDKQLAKAAQAYEEYLLRYPRDNQARLELANVEQWSGRFPAAETDYRRVLSQEPKNAHALLGMAQVSDFRGNDRAQVVRAYRKVVEADPGNSVAREKIAELAPSVSPSVGYSQRSFSDSDHFGRSVNTFQAAFPLAGGLRIAPFYRLGYFSQRRQIGGAECGTAVETDPRLARLSDRICAGKGELVGHSGGLRFELSPGAAFSFAGEVSNTRFDTRRSSLNASGEFRFRAGADGMVSLLLARGDAVYDVNTIGSLFAGIMSDTALLGYQHDFGKWRLWTSGGFSRYSEGTAGEFARNTQKRISTVLDYEVLPGFRAGYYARASGFTESTKLYFSPSFYGTSGFVYRFQKNLGRSVFFSADGELGYGRINRRDIADVNVFEVVAYPSLNWRITPDLALQFGYRFGRGRSSAFGSPVYTSGAFEFGLTNSFLPRLERVNPARLDIR